MIEGRLVLVVGGGRVGQRKVELLLDAGAVVALVCPQCVTELADLARAGKISWRQKQFAEEDLADAVLVFACTDDKHVNRRVLNAAKGLRTPCCCADGNWPDGDFVTPAILRSGNVLISVSTSGRSCRQSRLIKDNLSKHLNAIESSDLLVLGTSHEQLGMAERAPYHLLLREREALGAMIGQVWGVHEFFILNTCNRIELVAAIAREATTTGILRRLLRFDEMRPDLYYMKAGYDAFAHLCCVTAGICSQTPGEFHVVAQVKDAVEEAAARGWAGSIIRELCDTTLKISREIRREVEPLLDIAEIEDVCLRYLKSRVRDLQTKRVLVVGAGMVGRGLVHALTGMGVRCVWCYHVNVPDQFDPEFVDLVQMADLCGALRGVDVAISAVDVEMPLINSREHRDCIRRDAPVCLIDLGMPRNIDPALGAEIDNVELVDLDVLRQWFRESSGTLDRVMRLCGAVLERNRADYERIRDSMRGEL